MDPQDWIGQRGNVHMLTLSVEENIHFLPVLEQDICMGSTPSLGIECWQRMEKINRCIQHHPENVPNGLKYFA